MASLGRRRALPRERHRRIHRGRRDGRTSRASTAAGRTLLGTGAFGRALGRGKETRPTPSARWSPRTASAAPRSMRSGADRTTGRTPNSPVALRSAWRFTARFDSMEFLPKGDLRAYWRSRRVVGSCDNSRSAWTSLPPRRALDDRRTSRRRARRSTSAAERLRNARVVALETPGLGSLPRRRDEQACTARGRRRRRRGVRSAASFPTSGGSGKGAAARDAMTCGSSALSRRVWRCESSIPSLKPLPRRPARIDRRLRYVEVARYCSSSSSLLPTTTTPTRGPRAINRALQDPRAPPTDLPRGAAALTTSFRLDLLAASRGRAAEPLARREPPGDTPHGRRAGLDRWPPAGARWCASAPAPHRSRRGWRRPRALPQLLQPLRRPPGHQRGHLTSHEAKLTSSLRIFCPPRAPAAAAPSTSSAASAASSRTARRLLIGGRPANPRMGSIACRASGVRAARWGASAAAPHARRERCAKPSPTIFRRQTLRQTRRVSPSARARARARRRA